ncbi:MAG TPA: recombinase family protein, partial [Roseiflexaceae bacterium]
LCALFGTLLADGDGLYDPAQYNDRLLLGLKGTMSEAELHLLKQRMHQGKRNKARRGELAIPLPMGYVRRPSGEVTFDPDEQVQHVLHLVFRKFGDLGTLNALLRYLVAHEIQLGFRVREGISKGELEWRRPNRMTLQNLLKHPIYAGAYAYGRRQVDPRRQAPGQPRSGRATIAPAGWVAFLRDRLPAYISWEQYEWNLARLQANQARADALGVARQGTALLVGLVVCARCGRRLTVRYSGRGSHHLYVCTRQLTDYGGTACQQFAAACLETFVSQQVLAALEPAALEVSLATLAVLQRERDELGRLWQQRRERAAYEADRAARQFRLVEPEDRLVARQLEREWEAKLAAQQQLEEESDRVVRTQPRPPSAAERDAVRRLAADLPALWGAPTTTVAERKELIRQVVERVVVDVEGESERMHVTITWVGGWQTRAVVIRPVARLTQLSYYTHLCARLRALAGAGLSAATIAARLNAAGVRPPKRRERFGEQGVRDLLQRLGVGPHAIAGATSAPRGAGLVALGKYEWSLSDLARAVDMPRVTLFTWIRRG